MIGKIAKVTLTGEYPIVSTPMGRLHGYKDDGVFGFRGIKYANAARFEAPTPVEPWEGVKDALDYGYVSPLIFKVEPDATFSGPHRFWPEHEDCQYLNVWTSTMDAGRKLPVMVWLHGGGFTSGSSVEMYTYEGISLARTEDVVVVTVNHRLNILGYLDLSAYGEKYQYSGYVGILDIVEALKWVQTNISSFGGDPDNVTIFGQSGGGAKVASLMQMPETKGLYHKAIIQSGVPNFMPGKAPEGERLGAKKIVEALGLDADTIDQIQNVPFNQLAEIALKAWPEKGFGWSPVPDGIRLLPYAQICEETVDIPMIVGSNISEFSLNAPDGDRQQWTRDEKKAMLRKRFGDDTDAVVACFEATYPGRDIINVFAVDDMVRRKTLEFCAMRAARATAPVYNYLFTYEFPYRGGRFAWHCAEIPFIFKNTHMDDVTRSGGIDAVIMENSMSSAWMAFARTGRPQSRFLPHWPEFSADTKPTMLFDTYCEVKYGFDDDLTEMLSHYPPFSLTRMGARN